jgi:hypothetical protein
MALLMTVMLAGRAHAEGVQLRYDDDEVAHSREVISRHADRAHTRRITHGVTAMALGAGFGALGYYVVATGQPTGGLVDLSALQRAAGYSMMVLGGLAVVWTGPIVLLTRSGEERIRDGVEDRVRAGDAEGGVRQARAVIAERASASRHARDLVRGLGYGLTVIGVAGTVAAVATHDDSDLHDGLVATGVGGLTMGGVLIIGSMFEGSFEKLERDLQGPAPTVSAGIVPLRGGVMLGASGTF